MAQVEVKVILEVLTCITVVNQLHFHTGGAQFTVVHRQCTVTGRQTDVLFGKHVLGVLDVTFNREFQFVVP